MAALSMMTEEEQRLTDDDPDLLEVVGLTEEIRGKELLRAYKLRVKLENSARALHDEILEKWAKGTGRSVGAWKGDLKWAFAIDPDDLLEVFSEEGIGQGEWTQRIGTSHLGVIARAKPLPGKPLLTSRERAEWAVRAYHHNLSVDQLGDILRDHDLLAAKKSNLPLPTKLPATAAGLLELILAAVKANDAPLTITRGGKAKIAPALRKLADLIEQKHPGAEFQIGEAKPDGQVQ